MQLKLFGLPNISEEVCVVKEAALEDSLVQKEKHINVDCDRITRYGGSIQQNSVKNGSEPDIQSSSGKVKGGVVVESCDRKMQQLDNGNDSSIAVRILGQLVHRRQRSGNATGIASRKLENALGDEVIPCCSDVGNNIGQQNNGDTVVADKLENDELVEDQSFSYRSDCRDANLRKGLECLDVRPHSDCFMFVKPKLLDFDVIEDLNETFGLTTENRRPEKSAEKVCCTWPEPASSPDKENSGNNCLIRTRKNSSVKPEVSVGVGEIQRNSCKPNVAEHIGFKMTKCGAITDDHSKFKSISSKSKDVSGQKSPYLHISDFTLLEAVEAPDIEVNHVSFPPKQVCEASTELHIEKNVV